MFIAPKTMSLYGKSRRRYQCDDSLTGIAFGLLVAIQAYEDRERAPPFGKDERSTSTGDRRGDRAELRSGLLHSDVSLFSRHRRTRDPRFLRASSI